jgi:4'-phosphopantetheinyl transferase
MTSESNTKTFNWGDRAVSGTHPTLDDHDVHVWHRTVSTHESDLHLLEGLLSKDERARAERFVFEKHRSEFVLTRGTLRILVGSYLGIEPEQLRFAYSRHGKPSMMRTWPGFDLRFNVSHSAGRAVFAFVRGLDIGIDIEEIRMDIDTMDLAERFFSPNERERLRSLSGESLRRTFFRYWTRKEALIKANGQGLSIPLNEFDVCSSDQKPCVFRAIAPDPDDKSRWDLRDLTLHPNYAAALAIEKPRCDGRPRT